MIASSPQVVRENPTIGRRATYAAVAAAGLALAIAASGGTEHGLTGTEIPAHRLIIELPDWAKLGIVAALAAATLLVLALIVRLPRRRRKSEDDYEHYFEPPKLSLADYGVLTLLAGGPFAVAGAMLWAAHRLAAPAPSGGIPLASGETLHRSPSAPSLPSPGSLLDRAPTVDAVLGTLALLVALAGLGLMLWIYLGARWPRRAIEPLHPIRAALNAAVSDTLNELALGPDARGAIIACYRRFEAVLAGVEAPRRPWQTPTEFMRSVLQRYPLPHLAVWELTRLFELARFSRHALNARERDAALASLRAIKHALDIRETDHGPGQ